jgi:hypothetical protein
MTVAAELPSPLYCDQNGGNKEDERYQTLILYKISKKMQNMTRLHVKDRKVENQGTLSGDASVNLARS